MRRLIVSAAALAALATPASLFVMGGAAPAGATTVPKSIPCTSITGTFSATGTVTISKCTVPKADAKTYASASAKTKSLATGAGTITWASSKKTTKVKVTFKAATKNACTVAQGSEYVIKGSVVKGGTAAITPTGQVISLSICFNTTNDKITIAPKTIAEL
jgi:hypothetical protein